MYYVLIPDNSINITTTENQENTTIIPTTLATIGKYSSLSLTHVIFPHIVSALE